MNEEHPVREFLKYGVTGLAIGLNVFACLLFSFMIFNCKEAMDLRMIFFGIVMGLFGICVGVILLLQAINAFRRKRPYSGMGMLVFFVIALLLCVAYMIVYH